MKIKSEFLNEIKNRGFIYQSSDIIELDNLILKNKICGYIGFDITNDSLHIGSLVQLMLLYWLDFYGHSPIALVGGGTTLVGDPSGKDQSRKILEKKDIEKNISKITNTFEKFINLKKNAQIIDNYNWLSKINYINFLREIGSKITLNKMLTFDSIKSRLDREQPLSILEFNYMLLQAYDFYYLNKNHECVLQMGGSDQWGNIVSGIELIRKKSNKKAYGITSPLITNSDGTKMGKTAHGAVWLDEKKYSNFDFFQYWRNIDDNNVSRFLYLFTNLPLDEVQKLSQLRDQEINIAKEILAYEVTKIVRGKSSADEAIEIAKNTFDKNKIDDRLNNISVKFEEISNNGYSIIDAIQNLNLIESRSEIKRIIKSNGVRVNNENYNQDNFSLIKYTTNNEIKISVGKKKIGIIKILK